MVEAALTVLLGPGDHRRAAVDAGGAVPLPAKLIHVIPGAAAQVEDAGGFLLEISGYKLQECLVDGEDLLINARDFIVHKNYCI